MKSTYTILGLNIGLHDSSAALIVDGKMVAMGEQERFSRRKRAKDEAPIDAIKFCLEKGNIDFDKIDLIAFGSSQKLLDEWHELTEEEIKNRVQLDDPNRLFPKEIFSYSKLPEIVSIPHHLAHAASAYYMSGFEDSAILVVDNRGESTSTTLFHGNNGKIEFIEDYPITESLGLYYRTAAQYAGLCGEHKNVGKLMGLAPYGKPTEPTPLQVLDGKVTFDQLENISNMRGIDIPDKRTEQLLNYYLRNCYPYEIGLNSDVMAYCNFASSIQKSVENALVRYCEILKEKTKSKNLSIAGGVGLNCSANGIIAKSGIFENIFVQPVAGDAGVAIGAGFKALYEKSYTANFKMKHAYYGSEFSNEDVVNSIKKYNLKYEHLDNNQIAKKTAELLQNFKVVGWFQGKAEIGPRALGARSIIGNPRKRETLVRMNNIKEREMWRPLAPSVLEEKFFDYFVGPHASPFMIVATQVHHYKHKEVPAIVHIDGSARPQIVKRDTNPMYWNMINEFYKLTGIPIVVNTSFNTADEPIVHKPENAIEDYLKSDIDALVMNNIIIVK
ncbi:MAG: hypothetical protein LBI80_00850 [Endomicrobium sp.]|jgi:carbamoyltransferase|nr:hypothetical protein [Endomicrobium sp.]